MTPNGLILTADLHLRRTTWLSRTDMCCDAYESLAQICDLAIAQGYDIIMAGDVLDSLRPSATDIYELMRQTDRVAEAGRKVYAIGGNHDGDAWFSVCANIQNVAGRAFEPLPGLQAYGLNFYPRSELEKALTTVPPETKLLVCHQLLDIFSKAAWANMEATWVPPTVEMALVGDYHQTLVETLPRPGGHTTIFVSPGSTCLQDLGETPDKFIFTLMTGNTGKLKLERVPLLTRKFVSLVISTREVLDQYLGAPMERLLAAATPEALPEVIRKPILQVRYAPDIPALVDKVRRDVRGRAYIIFTPFSSARPQDSGYSAEQLDSDVDVLNTLIKRGETPTLYDLATRIVKCRDLQALRDLLTQVRMEYKL